jgi:hypothetical protein
MQGDIMRQAAKTLLCIGLSLLTACDNHPTSSEHSYLLEPEHIEANQLEQALLNHSEFQMLAEDVTMHLTEGSPDTHKLFLSGNQQTMAQVIALAQTLDTPQNYLLEISNLKPGSISTSAQQVEILLQPEEIIRLGMLEQRQGLWQGLWHDHLKSKVKAIELELSKNLQLKILIQNNNETIETNLALKLDTWVPIIKLSKGSPSKGKRINLRERELWLRLSRP